MKRAGPSIGDASPQFALLAGARLTWQKLGPPHARFQLQATGLPRGEAEILFLSLEYLEVPSVMEEVRLRLAIEPERVRLRRQLPCAQPSPVDWCDCLAIEHRSGVGYVVAGMMFVHWKGEPGGLP